MSKRELALEGDLARSPFGALRDPAQVAAADYFVAEGRRLVRLVLEQPGLEVRALLLSEQARQSLENEGVVVPASLDVWVAAPAVQRLVGGHRFHQGALALVTRPKVRGEGHLPALLRTGRPLLALECVTNPDNVGALMRTAAALGASGVVLDARSGDPLYRKALRNSVGAALTLPWVRVAALTTALAELRRRGARVIGLCCEPGAQDLRRLGSAPDPQRVDVILVGAEGAGLSASARAACDVLAHIAMQGGMDSLNVNAAAAIALDRQRSCAKAGPPAAAGEAGA